MLFKILTSRRFRVAFAFGLVYIFWGSTYLGIRIAVERIPPILMAGLRFSIAGSVLLAVSAASGRRVGVGRHELIRLAWIGFLLLSFSNAVLAWAELHVPSGLAALLVSIVPMWFLVIEQVLLPGGDRVTPRAVAGIALGVAGVAVLFWPRLRATSDLGWWQLIAALSLLCSSFTWAFGSVLARKWRLKADPVVASGWQMTIAGLVNGPPGPPWASPVARRGTWPGSRPSCT